MVPKTNPMVLLDIYEASQSISTGTMQLSMTYDVNGPSQVISTGASVGNEECGR